MEERKNLYRQTVFEIIKLLLKHISKIDFYSGNCVKHKIEDSDSVRIDIFGELIYFDYHYSRVAEGQLVDISICASATFCTITYSDLINPDVYKNAAQTILSRVQLTIKQKATEALIEEVSVAIRENWDPLFDSAYRHDFQKFIGKSSVDLTKYKPHIEKLINHGLELRKLRKKLKESTNETES